MEQKEIEKRFGRHKGTLEGPNPNEDKHQRLRQTYTQLAADIDKALPEGRNKSLALTALEEASMWSHKAIANDQ